MFPVNVPTESQESAVLIDLVNCLSGVDGQHIVAVPLEDPYVKREFKFAAGMGIFIKKLFFIVYQL